MTTYAKALVAVNAGAAVSGGVTVPSAASVAFTGESTTGWQSQTWQIYDYPTGWGTPAGWTLDASGVIFSTAVAPPAITLPANTSLWGKWALRLTVVPVNGGGVTLVDEATMLSMLSPKGQRTLSFNETSQFGGPRRSWAGEYQANQIAIEALLSAVAVTPGGSSGQVQFNSSNTFGGATFLTTDGTTWLGIGVGTLAGSGKLRLPYAATDVIIAAKDSGGTDRELLARTAADSYRIGPSGTGSALNMALAGNLVALSAASAMQMTGNGSSFIAFGTTPSTTGFLRFASAGGSVLPILSIKNTSAVDTPIIRTGAGDVVTFGNVGQDCSLVSTTNGFISFGASVSTTGLFRFGYTGASVTSLLSVKNSTATDTPIIRVGAGDACRFGNSVLDFFVDGAAIAINSGTNPILGGTSTTAYLGTTSSFNLGNQCFIVNIYAAPTGAVSMGLGGTTYIYANGTSAATEFGKTVGGLVVSPDLNGLRLTLTTGVPLPTADVALASTIYLTPFRSGSIALYSGAALSSFAWFRRDTAEISFSPAGLTTGKNYDIFAYWNGSAVALELSSAWTSDTARANALALQDGVWVKAADPTRRYVGTFRSISTTQTTDTATQRFLYNEYNQFDRHLLVSDATASWAYASTTIRQARGSSTNRVEVLVGQPRPVSARLDTQNVPSGAGLAGIVGIGLDSTTAYAANSRCNYGTGSGVGVMSNAVYNDVLAVGYHALNWLESCTAATSITFTGTGSGQASSLSARVTM